MVLVALLVCAFSDLAGQRLRILMLCAAAQGLSLLLASGLGLWELSGQWCVFAQNVVALVARAQVYSLLFLVVEYKSIGARFALLRLFEFVANTELSFLHANALAAALLTAVGFVAISVLLFATRREDLRQSVSLNSRDKSKLALHYYQDRQNKKSDEPAEEEEQDLLLTQMTNLYTN